MDTTRWAIPSPLTLRGTGCRTVHTCTLTATTVITHAYDAANRLVNVDGVDYTWDANGNLLSDGVRTFTYDAANRLMSVTSGTLTTTFEYEGLPAPVAQAQVDNRMAQVVNSVTTKIDATWSQSVHSTGIHIL